MKAYIHCTVIKFLYFFFFFFLTVMSLKFYVLIIDNSSVNILARLLLNSFLFLQ